MLYSSRHWVIGAWLTLAALCFAHLALASKVQPRVTTEDDRLNLCINLQTYREVMLSPYLQAWVGMQDRDQTIWGNIGDPPLEAETAMRRQLSVASRVGH